MFMVGYVRKDQATQHFKQRMKGFAQGGLARGDLEVRSLSHPPPHTPSLVLWSLSLAMSLSEYLVL